MDLPVYQTLLLQKHDAHILVVTLNRPQALNALNTQMGRDQIDLWTRLTAEPGEPRCVVLTGAGERAFCAGADLKERDGMTESVWRAQHEIFERAFMAPGAAAAGDRRGERPRSAAVSRPRCLRLHLRSQERAHGALRDAPWPHAGRRRHAEPRARRRRAARKNSS